MSFPEIGQAHEPMDWKNCKDTHKIGMDDFSKNQESEKMKFRKIIWMTFPVFSKNGKAIH